MSGKNLELSLVMRLRDLASSAFTRSQRDIQSGIAKTEKATDSLTRTVGNLGKVRSAADVLGLRTEQNIQREIQRTEAAYNRLARSGSMSMREQTRAAEATRNKIRELNNEMGKFTLAQKAMRNLQTGAAVAGGAAAAGYVLSKPIGQTMDYGMRLAQMSNTAFTERDTIGRIAGKRELNTSIEKSVRYGGGSRESAAETLDNIIASGAMSGKDAMAMLPTLMKTATASGADATQLSDIGIRAMQTFKIKPQDLSSIMDVALAAGQAGGFELKNMAKWLPQQMAMATNLGMSGKAGFSKLAAWNQAAVITAGTKDEAGNNLRDLLMEINTPHFIKHLKNVGVENADSFFLKSQANGVNKVDATIDLVKQIISKDKSYQGLQNKLKGAGNNEEKRSIIEAMSKQMEGSKVGKIFHNQQSLMGLLGLMNNQGYLSDVEGKMHAGDGNAVDKNFSVMSSEAGFKTQQAANEKIFATQNAFENLTPLIGSVADGFTSIAQEYPNLTAATVAATTALAALAAAAGAAGLVSLMGGGKGGGILETILTKTKGAPAALGRGALAAGTALGSAAGMAVIGAGAAGGLIGTGIYHGAVKGSEYEDRIGGMIATILAGWGNQEAKQALEVNLHLDGEQIATVVNRRNASTARRN